MRNPAEAILCLTESRFPARWYKRLSCEEDEMPPWLSPSCATREQGCCAIRRTYESMLESLHLLPADDACGRGIPLPQDMRSYGCSWVVDPRHGEGGYWYVVVDADAVVVCMDLSLRERAVHRGHSIELIGFGLYEHDMPSYFVEGLQPRRPALIGYRWGRQSYQQTICENHRFKSCSISLRPSALVRYARLLGVSVPVLVDSICLLDGSHELPELSCVLEELSVARPSASVAPAYYRAKLVEALAQLVDGCVRLRDGRLSLSSKERDLCSLVECRLREDASGDLSTRTLGKVLHVGEGQLIEAFKRVHGQTPQEYVRSYRMGVAARLLRESNRSVREIAALVGYSNQGAFTDAFKAHMGVVPSSYRAARPSS